MINFIKFLNSHPKIFPKILIWQVLVFFDDLFLNVELNYIKVWVKKIKKMGSVRIGINEYYYSGLLIFI